MTLSLYEEEEEVVGKDVMSGTTFASQIFPVNARHRGPMAFQDNMIKIPREKIVWSRGKCGR